MSRSCQLFRESGFWQFIILSHTHSSTKVTDRTSMNPRPHTHTHTHTHPHTPTPPRTHHAHADPRTTARQQTNTHTHTSPIAAAAVPAANPSAAHSPVWPLQITGHALSTECSQ